MRKMSTLYKQEFEPIMKDGKQVGRKSLGVSDELNEENAWVFSDPTTKAYLKMDGAACAVINGLMYARLMVGQTKRGGKKILLPENAIPAQPEPDPNTGQHPHWVPTKDNPQYKWFNYAFEQLPYEDGTYEMCGTKIVNDPEHTGKLAVLINHNNPELLVDLPEVMTKESLGIWIGSRPNEGVVFKNDSGFMCKLRRTDYLLGKS